MLFELATLRLTGERSQNLSAASGVASEKFGAIFPSLVAPKQAPKKIAVYNKFESPRVMIIKH